MDGSVNTPHVTAPELNELSQRMDQQLNSLSQSMGQELGKAKGYIHKFTADSWTVGTDCSIVIPAATHGLTGTAVFCQAFMLKDGKYRTGVWATMGTYAAMEANGSITLHCPGSAGYAGAVVLTAHSII